MRKIFISYHRDDSAGGATAIYQAFAREFGDDEIFKDVDNVPIAANWRTEVQQAIRMSTAMLLIVGPSWKLSDAVDLEIRQALANEVTIIPLLIDGASHAGFVHQLPDDLHHLSDLNAATVDYARFGRDLEPVIASIKSLRETEGDRRSERDRTRSNADEDAWRVESAARTGGQGTLGMEAQLSSSDGDAVHIRLRYDKGRRGHVRVNGQPTPWEIPPEGATRRPPRHGYQFHFFTNGRRHLVKLLVQWKNQLAWQRAKAPMRIRLFVDGRELE